MPSYTPLTLMPVAYPTLLMPGAPVDDPADDAAEFETTLIPLGAERQQQAGPSTLAQSAKPRSFVSRLLQLFF